MFKPISIKKQFVSSLLTVGLVMSGTITSSLAHAAGETGHSDFMQLMAMIYGLNPNVSEFISTGNQAMDNVPLAAATQSGAASNKIHFSSVTTPLDISEEKTKKTSIGIQHLKAVVAMISGNLLGGRTASLGNAESPEMFMKYLRQGDALGVAMGTHIMLDTMAPFHAGYKGAFTVVPLGVLSSISKIPFGHLTDGTNPDRLTYGKIVVAMYTMGNYFIALREAQRGIYGVNEDWLAKLEKQGVDVNDNISILRWFGNQPEVIAAFEQLPAKTNLSYLKEVLKEIKTRFIARQVFKNPAYLEDRFAYIEQHVISDYLHKEGTQSINDVLTDLINQSWQAGELNESAIIRDIFSEARTGATKLNQLVIESDLNSMTDSQKIAVLNQLKPDNLILPWSQEWIVAEIVNNYGHGVIKPKSSKFDSSYLFAPAEEKAQEIEGKVIHSLQSRYFGSKSKYVYHPMVEYWKKVLANWKSLSPELKGKTFFQKLVAASDVVVNTVLHEGYRLKTLREEMILNRATGKLGFNSDNLKVFFKTLAFIYGEGFFNPMTTAGNIDLMFKSIREKYVEELRANNPNGIFSEELISKSEAYNAYVTKKYNSVTPVGAVQNAANWIVKTFDKREGSRLDIMCKEILTVK